MSALEKENTTIFITKKKINDLAIANTIIFIQKRSLSTLDINIRDKGVSQGFPFIKGFLIGV